MAVMLPYHAIFITANGGIWNQMTLRNFYITTVQLQSFCENGLRALVHCPLPDQLIIDEIED
jgi:hypothetical protein